MIVRNLIINFLVQTLIFFSVIQQTSFAQETKSSASLESIETSLIFNEEIPNHIEVAYEKRYSFLNETPLSKKARDGAIFASKRWGDSHNFPLSVCFYIDVEASSTNNIVSDIMAAAKEWQRDDNAVRFNFSDPLDTTKVRRCKNSSSADIRIGFSHRGYWSVVGTDSVKVKRDIASNKLYRGESKLLTSMNFGGWDIWSARPSQEYVKKIARHEFGHALGMPHEHQNPNGKCDDKYDWGKLLEDTKQIGWDEKKTKANFGPINSELLASMNFDNTSVMMYRIPRKYFEKSHQKNNPCMISNLNEKISEKDYELISKMYPKDPSLGADWKEDAIRNLSDELGENYDAKAVYDSLIADSLTFPSLVFSREKKLTENSEHNYLLRVDGAISENSLSKLTWLLEDSFANLGVLKNINIIDHDDLTLNALKRSVELISQVSKGDMVKLELTPNVDESHKLINTRFNLSGEISSYDKWYQLKTSSEFSDVNTDSLHVKLSRGFHGLRFKGDTLTNCSELVYQLNLFENRIITKNRRFPKDYLRNLKTLIQNCEKNGYGFNIDLVWAGEETVDSKDFLELIERSLTRTSFPWHSTRKSNFRRLFKNISRENLSEYEVFFDVEFLPSNKQSIARQYFADRELENSLLVRYGSVKSKSGYSQGYFVDGVLNSVEEKKSLITRFGGEGAFKYIYLPLDKKLPSLNEEVLIAANIIKLSKRGTLRGGTVSVELNKTNILISGVTQDYDEWIELRNYLNSLDDTYNIYFNLRLDKPALDHVKGHNFDIEICRQLQNMNFEYTESDLLENIYPRDIHRLTKTLSYCNLAGDFYEIEFGYYELQDDSNLEEALLTDFSEHLSNYLNIFESLNEREASNASNKVERIIARNQIIPRNYGEPIKENVKLKITIYPFKK